MNANEVLIDVLEDNRRRLQRPLETMSVECLAWKPETEANNILLTLWHMGRILDVFLNRQARGCPEKEVWLRKGWIEQTGYNPAGIGQNGWGMLTGYTQAEVKAMPLFTRAQVLTYIYQVYDDARDFLTETSEQQLFSPGVGLEGKYTQYQCIQMALLDNVRHLGEVFAIKSSWDRHHKVESSWP